MENQRDLLFCITAGRNVSENACCEIEEPPEGGEPLRKEPNKDLKVGPCQEVVPFEMEPNEEEHLEGNYFGDEYFDEYLGTDPNYDCYTEDPSQLYRSQPSSDNETSEKVYSGNENNDDYREDSVHTSSEKKKKRPRDLELNFLQKRHKKELSCNSNQLEKPMDADIVPEKQDGRGSSEKRSYREWDMRPGDAGEAMDDDILLVKKKQKTGWASDDTQLRMLGPLKLPDLTEPVIDIDPEVQKLNARLLSVKRKLQSGDIANNLLEGQMSPSPPPIYDECGFQINSKEVRLHSKLTRQRQSIITELVQKNPTFHPPTEYEPPKYSKKLYIPVKEYPGYNFIGLIIGPRGNTQKRMEKETGARILLRGNGLVKEGKAMQKKDAKPDPVKNEDLHVLVQADSQSSLDAAVSMVEKLLVPVEERYNKHRLGQLRELARLKDTDEETGISNMGNSVKGTFSASADVTHSTSACGLSVVPIPGRKTDSKQACVPSEPENGAPHIGSHSIATAKVAEMATPSSLLLSDSIVLPKAYDEANLYVSFLPLYVNEDILIDLFSPFGRICNARVVKDRITGVSKGYGFVKYTNAANAALAIEQMNGFMFGGNALAVRIAGMPPSYDRTNLFVGYLPPTVDDYKLIDMFSPFGTICHAKVVRDKYTRLSKGSGFVRYTDAASAVNAIAQMNGYMIDGKVLAVRFAEIPPASVHSNMATGALPNYNYVPGYPDPAVIAQGAPSSAGWQTSPTLLNCGSLQSWKLSAYSCQTPGHTSLYAGKSLKPKGFVYHPGI